MPKHEKITTYSKQEDGSVKIESKSYYEKLSHELIEVEKNVPTTHMTLKKDVDRILDHVEDGCSQLVITIKVVKGNIKLTKRWVELKKDYPRI